MLKLHAIKVFICAGDVRTTVMAVFYINFFIISVYMFMYVMRLDRLYNIWAKLMLLVFSSCTLVFILTEWFSGC